MLKFVREYKSTYDFQRIDFEADLQSLYTEVRRCMTSLYPDDFGTQSLTEAETSILSILSILMLVSVSPPLWPGFL